jgi:hypothetical protein
MAPYFSLSAKLYVAGVTGSAVTSTLAADPKLRVLPDQRVVYGSGEVYETDAGTCLNRSLTAPARSSNW